MLHHTTQMTRPTDPLGSRPRQTFLNWTYEEQPTAWSKADVLLVGIPQSEPYPGEPSPNDQSRAPDAIRQMSGQFCDGLENWDFDLGAPLADVMPQRCVDGGNVCWNADTYLEHSARVRDSIAPVFAAGTQLFVLGGDHGITTPVLQALDLTGTSVHVVHIDAHLDWRDEVNGVRNGYSSPLRRASELRCVTGMTQIGLRGTGSARRPEYEAACAYGSNLITASAVRENGIEHVLEQIPRDIPIYLTIDADGLDPTCMPGVQAPSPGGLQADVTLAMLRALAIRQPILGMDLVEVSPAYDIANQLTSITAGRLLMAVLGASWAQGGGFARRRIGASKHA